MQYQSFVGRSASSKRHSASRRSMWRLLQRGLQPPQGVVAALAEAIAWLAGFAAMRLAANLVLVVAPGLWGLVAVLLLLPAALALSLAALAPQLSVLLGYRLILAAMGLLLGGRL
ncbi:MAG: hypothetical protein KME20_16090 [Kaiparowitsia implicata GSE-PSE-MK54-09C]|jgi:hypothetical protein|nr:hypothetical protein [Kaiparowitsia implicata GSE-PSE-MK54-09C]